jgi:hypothetical protein
MTKWERNANGGHKIWIKVGAISIKWAFVKNIWKTAHCKQCYISIKGKGGDFEDCGTTFLSQRG